MNQARSASNTAAFRTTQRSSRNGRDMGEGDGAGRRFVLDFGRCGKIYSHKGVRLASREQSQALLDTIRILAQEIGKQAAVDRFAPTASKRHRIGPWLERWLSDFEQQ